jgi:acetyltransferase-like isoleucine patch superfamily enzyme
VKVFLDFLMLFSGLALTCWLSASAVAQYWVPYSVPVFGKYHILADFLAFLLGFGLITGAIHAVFLKIYPLKPGVYSMEHPHYWYWKTLMAISQAGRVALLPYTYFLLRPLIARLFGATIGQNVLLGGDLSDPSLTKIGDHSVIGYGAILMCHAITDDHIKIAPIYIGEDVTIGVKAVIMPGVVVGNHASILPNSVVVSGTHIPEREIWAGIPARHISVRELITRKAKIKLPGLPL